MRAVVVPYRLAWPIEAARLTAELVAVLGPSARRIEHIGSTAIPGMAAKDVVDLQVGVDDLADADEQAFGVSLAALGFVRSSHATDHVPTGRRSPPSGWAKRLWTRRNGTGVDVNLHVRAVGSPNERFALVFRDWFRAHGEAVAAYGDYKRQLAGRCPDAESYAEAKGPVVDVIMVAANEWAEATGWRYPP